MESSSIRQLAKQSGHSPFKLKTIKNHWLGRDPKEHFDLGGYKHLLFDGTYFHKSGCFMTLMAMKPHKIIANQYAQNESYQATYPWFKSLQEQGLEPFSLTMDGHLKVMEALKAVWPKVKIQRCLYHIQRQGLMWLRTYPKTEAGRILRMILSQLTRIKSVPEKNAWVRAYKSWSNQYSVVVRSLPRSSIAFTDLKRTMALINNALPDMFHYMKDQRIPKTTNLLESFYSRLKADYRRHRGLSHQHKMAYLKWYCYFKNSNTF
jgi:transposase-like protein